uniref:Uncharacterized protein n=1 Tax=Candidatus Kentrum sp. LPFa TaxID=2126335 RepID=A0A450Y685_9GAMM|nr:MAG: hypothetical protein BECKLPF1236C_GA0070990_107521 [Candidatus Kentron sp. LPFa]
MTPKLKVTTLRHREVGWRATGSEPAVRRITNPIRWGAAASLRVHGEAWKIIFCVVVAVKTTKELHFMFGGGMLGR